MKTILPLARWVAPVQGESFSSYVERLAAFHKVDVLVILNMFGIIARESYERLNGYGIWLDDRQVERFSIAAKLSPERIRSMLMSSFDGIVFDLPRATLGDAQNLRKVAMTEWAYFSGSHVCPGCIQDDRGAWQLGWKLPWSFACVRHRCYLASHCPTCERRLGIGRSDRSLSPLYVRQTPALGRCGNRKPEGVGRTGRLSQPCGHVLSDIPTQPAEKAALQTQEILNNVLRGTPLPLFGASVTSIEYLQDVRSLCAMILYCAEPEDLQDMNAAEATTFSRYVAERHRILGDRADSIKPRNSARMRVFFGAPTDPLLVSAVSKLAIHLLGAPTSTDLAKKLQPLAERLIARSSSMRWEVANFFRFSSRIAPAFADSLAYYGKFDRSIGRRSTEASADQYAFGAAHVPQLFWSDDFQRDFAGLLPHINENNARRFCAMSLLKLITQCTWGEAAMQLGLPVNKSIGMANRCVGILALEGTKVSFRKALHAVARRLSAAPDKVDYGLRREILSNLNDIPPSDWASICASSNITPGRLGRRSRFAAAWLWADLTGGDWTLSPALVGEDTINSREVFRTLCKSALYKAFQRLREYGRRLI